MSLNPIVNYNELRALRTQLQDAINKIDAVVPGVDSIIASAVANINTASATAHTTTRNAVNTKGDDVKTHVTNAVQTYGKGIKNVQRGASTTIVSGAGAGTATVYIAAVNTAKAYCNLLSAHPSSPVHISLTAANTLLINTETGGKLVNWEVIEWM